MSNARKVFSKANQALRNCEEKEHRKMLIDSWKEFEEEFGDSSSIERVTKLIPKKMTKRRQVTTDDGSQTKWEEYTDYVFPDDEAAKPSLLFLARAKEWVKKQKDEDVNEGNQDNDSSEIDPNLDKDDSDVDVGSSSDSSSSSSDSDDNGSDSSGSKRRARKKQKTSNSTAKNDNLFKFIENARKTVKADEND